MLNKSSDFTLLKHLDIAATSSFILLFWLLYIELGCQTLAAGTAMQVPPELNYGIKNFDHILWQTLLSWTQHIILYYFKEENLSVAVLSFCFVLLVQNMLHYILRLHSWRASSQKDTYHLQFVNLGKSSGRNLKVAD